MSNRLEEAVLRAASYRGKVLSLEQEDKAIEYPLGDDNGRSRFVRLYAEGVKLAEQVVSEIVKRTEGVSPAFIKELASTTTKDLQR